MKLWLFALFQSIIAAAGLAACFYADSVLLAGLAAGSAAAVGIAQPLLAARRQQKLSHWQEQQHQHALQVLDDQADETLQDVIPPPFPHRPTVAAFLEMAGLGNPQAQLQQYDDLVEAIREADPDCPSAAAAFCAELTGNVLGVALEGLAALAVGDLPAARRLFEEATVLNSGWAMPWLGWAAVCYAQKDFSTLAAEHPHINGVELLCYDCGDEETFARLTESERDSLVELYQQTVTSIGNYYAAAELARSRNNCEQMQDAARHAA